jgi:hypothetical protein
MMSIGSFPSRAVVCVVVCAWTALMACTARPNGDPPITWGSGGQTSTAQGGETTTVVAHGGTGSGGMSISVPSTPMDNGNGCKPLSCHPPGGDYCGMVGDGCQGKMDCGACQRPDWACDKGLCKGNSSCMRRTACTEGTATYCGKIGDNCGGALDCGDCMAPSVCGGNGVSNVCGNPACEPIKCALPGGQYCGVIGDGCGHSLDCGSCPNGDACGGTGIPSVCPGSVGATKCVGIRCNVEKCSGGGTTSLSGVVYDPAGVNPIYNVRVYVPNAELEPLPTGATCEQCNANLTGEPITTALTDSAGRFRLENVPTGANIPLVMQVGRWRRKVTIPNVNGCTDNPLTDHNLTRLPRNQGEGHIPLIAITTGASDALECLIPRIGLDRSEVTTDSGSGRVHLYAGGMPGANGAGRGAISMEPGGTLPAADALWSSASKMRGYDIVMFSCEGGEARPSKDPYLANFESYINNGGRAFLSHYHYYWLSHGSAALKGTANYTGTVMGQDPPSPSTGIINTSFPKGAALADWLMNVGASTVRGELSIYESRNSVTTAIAPTQDWISIPMNSKAQNRPALQYMTFNTPVGVPAEQQCGRVVDTDLHVGASVVMGQDGDTSKPGTPYPGGCTSQPNSPQIKALEFIFFDLAACVQPDTQKPDPPPPPPPTQTPPPPVPVPPPPPPPPPL